MFAFTFDLDVSIEEAITRLKAQLATEKMGVVSDIDLQASVQAKLGAAMMPYRLLGICGPGFAKRVIDADADMGALLPCGCAVYEIRTGQTRIALRNPLTVSDFSEDKEIKAAMHEAHAAFERIGARLSR